MENEKQILVVDDESQIRTVLRLLLENKGYLIEEASNGEIAVEKLKKMPDIDLIIMDIMMPKMSGFEATQIIRKFSYVPVLFLSAKSMTADKASAYGNGGDDYIVKPFESSELLMKVDALIRRYRNYKNGNDGGSDNLESYMMGISINRKTRSVYINGQVVELRDKEMDILLYLTANRGKVVDVDTLYKEIWGEMYMPSSANTIMVHILNLRKKLEPVPSSPKFIRTVWGRGYQIV